MKFKFLPLILASILATACATTKPTTSLDGEWTVVELNGKTLSAAPDETPFLGFDKSNIYGFTGCNRLTGSVNQKDFFGGRPNLSGMGMTRMLCHETYEEEFMDALARVSRAEVKGNNMELRDKGGNVIVKLQKK